VRAKSLDWGMGLQVGSVSNMFRYLNIRTNDVFFTNDPERQATEGKWKTRLGDPPNFPDGFYSAAGAAQKTVVVVHGLDWDESETPAGHAEIFKRLFQSGCNARYIGVSWAADLSRRLAGPVVYATDVIGAFVAARYVTQGLDGFLGPDTTVLAHSLGNVLVSSAIQDHGMQVGAYAMLSAAVPVESYDGRAPVGNADRSHMTPGLWKNYYNPGLYPERVTCAGWSKLFSPGDPRHAVTWDGRFRDVVSGPGAPAVWQFYSTGEEVLKPSEGTLPDLVELRDLLTLLPRGPRRSDSVAGAQERVWVYHEMTKGDALFLQLQLALYCGPGPGGAGPTAAAALHGRFHGPRHEPRQAPRRDGPAALRPGRVDGPDRKPRGGTSHRHE